MGTGDVPRQPVVPGVKTRSLMGYMTVQKGYWTCEGGRRVRIFYLLLYRRGSRPLQTVKLTKEAASDKHKYNTCLWFFRSQQSRHQHWRDS